MKDALDEAVAVAAYAGARIDLVQAAGGNVSAKRLDGVMHVKASGARLSAVSRTHGLIEVESPAGLAGLDGDEGARRLVVWNAETTAAARVRPSMEVSMHAVLGRVVLHTHPVELNGLLCATSADRFAREALGDQPFASLPYAMPGAELGTRLLELARACLEHGREIPRIILLENHGLVVHGESAIEVIALHDRVIGSVGQWLRGRGVPRGPGYVPSLVPTSLAESVKPVCAGRPAMVSLDGWSGEPWQSLFPDAVVFCGPEPVSTSAAAPIERARYETAWGVPPRVAWSTNALVTTGVTQAEAEAAAEVAWAHLEIHRIARTIGEPRPLPRARIVELLQSEAEAHRQRIGAAS